MMMKNTATRFNFMVSSAMPTLPSAECRTTSQAPCVHTRHHRMTPFRFFPT